ncbi:uncharacterized protein LOC120004167 isoform X2 [Tripterygium wilfordii]|uniref:uncharacterized protein LOC120004167 isoform X2 n=1 Tax=Tripterygium wilfordii TaxID=458696 RepID=UPI0018F7FCF9|nr:uncharacterized protein LOC120004167 isoform X2 [Tripterygium wilfordii]
MEFTPISNLVLGLRGIKVRARVALLWNSTNPLLEDELVSVDFLLGDEEGITIHGSMRKEDATRIMEVLRRGVTVKFLKTPRVFSHLNSALFVFQVLLGENRNSCTNCSLTCKLNDGSAADCGARKILYTGLQDGNHTFEVCTNGSQGVGCASYNWTIDTIPPTAHVTSLTPITSALNVSVDISFTEPCIGDGGFRCSSVNACNLLVYGAGHVIPSSLIILQPNLKYSLLVGLSSSVLYGRVILVTEKLFCTDIAGNRFTRTANSSFFVHFDRRNVYVKLRTYIPEKLLQLNHEFRTVLATHDYDNLKGAFLPIRGEDLLKRRFGFQVTSISTIAVVTICLDTSSIVSRQGTPVSPIAPVTFLFDSDRPAVRLSTTSSSRTKEHIIPIWIKFMKPVFGFNSSFISISGGHLQSFSEISRSTYIVEIEHVDDLVSVKVPENVAADVAGNKNLASNVLQVRHYSVPIISSIISTFATVSFVATSFTAGLLTVSTASLQSVGAFSRSSRRLTSDPARILFRSACHIQVFALSRWLAVTLPIDYYEFVRGLEWSIPYFSLPWESENNLPVMIDSSSSGFDSNVSKVQDLGTLKDKNLRTYASVYGLPLTPMEYRSFFESQNFRPEAEYILDLEHSNGWRHFMRSMLWLAVIGGSLMLVHALLLLILKFKKITSAKRKGYGALTFPRFEIFLIILSLPCTCMASTAIIRGGTLLGVIVGILLLGAVFLILLALLLFLSFGITLGKLLRYKEVHQEGEIVHWYQEIVRVTLGPGKRGQWAWKKRTNSIYLVMLGPLFEDLRGPPMYILTRISSGNSRYQSDRIFASDDENEDTEAPFIQKLFGILRIYYALLELVKRVSLGIMAGAFLNRSSKVPTLTLLCISSFQLFFLVLKKPFIKKKVQMVEIISVSCEVGLFATCFVLLKIEISVQDETRLGIFMIILFLLGFVSQLINEWYALYRQTVQLDPAQKSFLAGLKLSSIGFLLFFIPQKLIESLESKFPANRDGGAANASSPASRNRSSGSGSSGSTDKPWMKRLRELAGFSPDGNGSPNDPSSSRARWSGLWSAKRSGSSSVKTSSDFKPKSKALDKDLEAIFASK